MRGIIKLLILLYLQKIYFMNLLLIVIGLVLLILGGNWLLKSAVGFSLRLNIPKIVIGMTVVSFATSAPELIVSIKSALENHADIAFGNVIGSNIANLGLVLGITILISTISVEKSFYKKGHDRVGSDHGYVTKFPIQIQLVQWYQLVASVLVAGACGQ